MFDVVKDNVALDAGKYGFTKLYSEKEVQKNIVLCENLAGAATNRNKKTLIMLKELDFDLGSLKLLAEKKKACLLFDISKIIMSKGLRRSIEMAKLRTTLKYCNKYGVFYAFASFAESELTIRNAHELIAICWLFGLNSGQAKFALEMVKHY